jgi:large-conductance mechanosensitive channel
MMLKEFREFAIRGNVMDLAVAVTILDTWSDDKDTWAKLA